MYTHIYIYIYISFRSRYMCIQHAHFQLNHLPECQAIQGHAWCSDPADQTDHKCW